MKHKGKKIFLFLLFSLITAEIFLRVMFGFCDAVLIQEDPAYEYIARPNQTRHRFGKHIKYNNYSMRSDNVDTSAVTVLGFGDSVINGGTLTDQDSLATTLLSDSLSSIKRKKYQVLNISAGSWGPDNCASYLAKFGDFSAKAAFLVVSSHDAFDNMDFKKVVGKDPSYPNKQYELALLELADRYVIPRLFTTNTSENLGINKNVSEFNKGFSQLASYFQKKNVPFFIYLHPEEAELKSGSYNAQGQLIISYCEENKIPLIKSISYLRDVDYRDNNHLNEQGQKVLFKLLFAELKKYAL